MTSSKIGSKRKRFRIGSESADELNCIEVAQPRNTRALHEVDVAQAQNKTCRVLDYVLIPKLIITKNTPKPERLIEKSARKTPAATQHRPRRAAFKESIVFQTSLSESSEDESKSDGGVPETRIKSKKQSTIEDSDFEFAASSEDEFEDDYESTASDDGSSAKSIDDDIEIEEKEQPRKRQKSTSNESGKVAEAALNSKPNRKASSSRMANILTRGKDGPKGLARDLPPVSKINEIFQDITEKALGLGFGRVTRHLAGTPLRVATLCSGTESPLLALQMIQDALKTSCGDDLAIDHLFSAEIVPFKQAYIERNFAPPIIFRDITELIDAVHDDNPTATTAYGARVQIPTHVHVVIAGTSCVDFSRLNTHKKGLGDSGESAKTWHSVLAFCKAFRPPIVLLENVKNADWDLMLEHYEEIGYESAGVLVDTKDFYIPHTRQRGYMVCFDKTREAKESVAGAGLQWQELMRKMRRFASSPVSSFLLPNDAVKSKQQLRFDEETREVDWSACEIRQMHYRQQKGLGNARPFTKWQESGTIAVPEGGSSLWYHKQVERVLDCIECAILRKALPKNGMYDARFKTRIWDLSQNIDRNEDTSAFGITGCITPSGIFFLSDAGRSLTSDENLKLQGLPLDRISWTTETKAEMQDLAGNAMTTTVVGSAIVAALICGHKLIDVSGTRTSTQGPEQSVSPLVVGPEKSPVSDDCNREISVEKTLHAARRALRRCQCEGPHGITTKPIQQCQDCSHTACVACSGNPVHNYRHAAEINTNRLLPKTFEEDLRSKLPLRLAFEGVSNLSSLVSKAKGSAAFVAQYLTSVQNAAKSVFTLSRIRRTHGWTIEYQASAAHLHLALEDHQAEWRLFAHPDSELACNSELRQALEQPVATCEVSHSFFTSEWRWRVPDKHSVKIKIQGKGPLVPSWWARSGIPALKDHQVWERLEIDVPQTHHNELESSITGTYKHLPQCGKACDSVFRRVDEDENLPPTYLFLDPTQTGPPEQDTFVFSRNKSRLEYDEIRPTLGRIASNWAPWGMKAETIDEEVYNTHLQVDSAWIKLPKGVALLPQVSHMEIFTPQKLNTLVNSDSCAEASRLVSCTILSARTQVLGNESLLRVKNDDSRFFFDNAWMFEAMRRHLPTNEWRVVQGSGIAEACLSCEPKKPSLRWKLSEDGKTIMPYEDTAAAARYEQAVKTRPAAIVVEAESDLGSIARLTLGVNIKSLIHRACARLPSTSRDILCTWRLTTNATASNQFNFRPFQLTHTTGVSPYNKDLKMSVPLFPKQKLALAWMKQQEIGVEFSLEQSEEAELAELDWRLEVRAQTSVLVRGGICADHPGFGKTVTSLALIQQQLLHTTPETIVNELKPHQIDSAAGLIPIAATLIVCPGTLVKQWKDEIDEKLSYHDDVVLGINNAGDLSRCTLSQFKKARIILVNRAVLGSELYAERLATFAGTPGPATNSGRSFAQWLEFATGQIAEHLQILENSGIAGLTRHVKAKYQTLLQSDVFKANVPSRRLRGKDYGKDKSVKKPSTEKAAATELNTESLGRPLLEMFFFNRLIVDEFHQFTPREFAAIKNLQADKRWGLSATPALDDFYDLAHMGGLIGVPLRIGSDARGIMKPRNARSMHKDMTDFERFDAMRQMPSDAVHARIYEIDQLFLATFVRQNIMDNAEIKYRDQLVPVALDLDHRVMYTELSQHLNSMDMRIRRGKKLQATHREARLSEAVQNSDSAEEALSKTAAFYQRADGGNGIDWLISLREGEVEAMHTKLRKTIAQAMKKEAAALDSWRFSRLEGGTIGDETTIVAVKRDFETVGVTALPASKPDKTLKRKRKGQSSDSDDDGENDTSEAKATGTRVLTTEINVICNRLVVSQRSLRYLRNVKRLYEDAGSKSGSKPPKVCDSSTCKSARSKKLDVAVSAFCGHTVCKDCYKILTDKHLSQCPTSGCASAMHSYHLLWTSKMGDLHAPSHTPFGGKIQATVNLIKEIKLKQDKAIIFVQYGNQLEEMERALLNHGIEATVVSETGHRAATQIEDFKQSDTQTVLVLDASSETAAGCNLQCANHVVFLSPLVRDSQYGYSSTMAQAIGRVRRHGQAKKIHVYRVVALDTIDVDILEHRERRLDALAERHAPEVKQPASDRTPDRGGEAKPQRTQLVREDGLFSLRPQSWLCGEGLGQEEKMKGKDRVLGWEDFSSLVKFSRTYAEDDE